MSSQYILQIETSTAVCSVALSANGKTVCVKEVDEPNAHASRLTLLIEELLAHAAISTRDLSAVAVSKGPGSYTGLRIGVSTAKGLCYAADLPLIAVGTLEGMVHGFATNYPEKIMQDTWLCPMIDARRMEVYSAIYNSDLEATVAVAANIIDANSFEYVETGRQVLLFGSGADKFDALFAGSDRVQVQPEFKNSASYLSPLAHRALVNEEFVDVAYFEPYYLKDFVATTPKSVR